MSELEFWSPNGEFGVKITEQETSVILRRCIQAHPHETGGILVGYYTETHNCAVITAVSGAPKNSKSGRAWFIRRIGHLQKWLNLLWNKHRHYYLGEWHYHPGGSSSPSGTDVKQMQEISISSHYHCPEPILLIVGNGATSLSFSISMGDIEAFVFPRDEAPIRLVRRSTQSVN